MLSEYVSAAFLAPVNAANTVEASAANLTAAVFAKAYVKDVLAPKCVTGVTWPTTKDTCLKFLLVARLFVTLPTDKYPLAKVTMPYVALPRAVAGGDDAHGAGDKRARDPDADREFQAMKRRLETLEAANKMAPARATGGNLDIVANVSAALQAEGNPDGAAAVLRRPAVGAFPAVVAVAALIESYEDVVAALSPASRQELAAAKRYVKAVRALSVPDEAEPAAHLRSVGKPDQIELVRQ
eukprot:gene8989-8127_t